MNNFGASVLPEICYYFLTVTMFFALAKCRSIIFSEGIQSFESHQHFKILTFQCFPNGWAWDDSMYLLHVI